MNVNELLKRDDATSERVTFLIEFMKNIPKEKQSEFYNQFGGLDEFGMLSPGGYERLIKWIDEQLSGYRAI